MTRDEDVFKDHCGVFGIYGHEEASKIVYLGLYALQHRGQESAGIAASDGHVIKLHRDMGYVADAFEVQDLEALKGHMAIGHVRYSTAGASISQNIQPIKVDYSGGSLALVHNGNLVNAPSLRRELEEHGCIFQSTTDSEVIVHLIARSGEADFLFSLVEALKRLEGAFSLILLTNDSMIGVRDPWGFRPLCLGRLQDNYVLASESCAFDIIDAQYERDIEPGEIVIIDKDGLRSIKPFDRVRVAPCIFEFIYFARPDSIIFSRQVQEVRSQLGIILAQEAGVEADIVISVPDSSTVSALGYAREANIPFEMGLIRNHYIGRTFIEPSQSIRDFGAKIKYNPNKQVLEGKRVVVIDDSIVRGTTSRKIIKMIRSSNPKEIHLRIASPPIEYPCFYGIDTPDRSKLIAATHSLEEIRKYLGVDSLQYLSIPGLQRAAHCKDNEFCLACFDGNYPVKFPGQEQGPCQQVLSSLTEE